MEEGMQFQNTPGSSTSRAGRHNLSLYIKYIDSKCRASPQPERGFTTGLFIRNRCDLKGHHYAHLGLGVFRHKLNFGLHPGRPSLGIATLFATGLSLRIPRRLLRMLAQLLQGLKSHAAGPGLYRSFNHIGSEWSVSLPVILNITVETYIPRIGFA